MKLTQTLFSISAVAASGYGNNENTYDLESYEATFESLRNNKGEHPIV